MGIRYLEHALLRMHARGPLPMHVEHVINHPHSIVAGTLGGDGKNRGCDSADHHGDRMMRTEYDKEADAAYIYLEYPVEKAAKPVKVSDRIILDFDANHKLVGVEVLDASEVLSSAALRQAIPAGRQGT